MGTGVVAAAGAGAGAVRAETVGSGGGVCRCLPPWTLTGAFASGPGGKASSSLQKTPLFQHFLAP